MPSINHEAMIHRIRQVILDRDNNKCRACNCKISGRNAIVHHLDGDRANNDAKNLISLCRECHDKMPKAIYMTSRLFPSTEKTTTPEGKREYMKLYMRYYRAKVEARKS